MKNLKLIVGRSNPKLGDDIARHLGIEPCKILLENFADGEIRFKIGEDIRGNDVFIVQSTFPNADNILELLLMIDAAKRASAQRVTAVIPYFGYARQDRKDQPRVPITSKLIANLIVSAGADRVLTMDLHAAQIQGFFDIPTDQLVSDNLFKHHIETDIFGRFDCPAHDNFVIVSPDIGGVKRVENIASRLDLPIAVIYKKRKKVSGEAQALKIVGEVAGKNVIILDDIIDTAGTMKQACLKLKDEGCEKIFVCATHPLLSGPAMERLDSSRIEGLTITNTIPLPMTKNRDYINVIETGRFFAMAIHHIHFEKSVSVLLYEDNSLDLWDH
ncbi:MAG TPA: ribose-phosphate pyrophosphokinase [candidate division Zixibacteria bacterium]|nr:ribose-phosphate pyrophosphokinase [candidate division Zixibacteria bacterium]